MFCFFPTKHIISATWWMRLQDWGKRENGKRQKRVWLQRGPDVNFTEGQRARTQAGSWWPTSWISRAWDHDRKWHKETRGSGVEALQRQWRGPGYTVHPQLWRDFSTASSDTWPASILPYFPVLARCCCFSLHPTPCAKITSSQHELTTALSAGLGGQVGGQQAPPALHPLMSFKELQAGTIPAQFRVTWKDISKTFGKIT